MRKMARVAPTPSRTGNIWRGDQTRQDTRQHLCLGQTNGGLGTPLAPDRAEGMCPRTLAPMSNFVKVKTESSLSLAIRTVAESRTGLSSLPTWYRLDFRILGRVTGPRVAAQLIGTCHLPPFCTPRQGTPLA